jgi:hypothetical protein
MARTTVSETQYTDKDGNQQTQYRTTVPKQLAEAFDLGGATIEWEVESQNALRITKVEK